MVRVLDAAFVVTATKPLEYPQATLPEIAFVGRSNVGKSSMINALVQRKKLVRISRTPGRTRTINFFDVTIEHAASRRVLRLCDLPGYGFAKAPKTERQKWQVMILEYLQRRPTLCVVVALIDAEIGPTESDLQTLDFIQGIPPKILMVATKLDRLGKAARKPRLEALTSQLELPSQALFGFSAVEKIGYDEVWRGIIDSIE